MVKYCCYIVTQRVRRCNKRHYPEMVETAIVGCIGCTIRYDNTDCRACDCPSRVA